MNKSIVLVALFGLLAVSAGAEEDKAQVVKYRQVEMGAIGRHFGAIRRLLTGQVNRPQDLPLHAQALADLALDIPGQFPAGTGPDAKFDTDALDKVWTDTAGFAKASKDFEGATAALLAAVKANDLAEANKQFEAVDKACDACHDTYKKKD